MVHIIGKTNRTRSASDYHVYSAAGKCTKGSYKGETCLMPKENKYPVTENGTLSKSRVQAALVYGSKMGVLDTLKKNGLCGYVKKAGIKKSDVCGIGSKDD
jgi:hypothetical protein